MEFGTPKDGPIVDKHTQSAVFPSGVDKFKKGGSIYSG